MKYLERVAAEAPADLIAAEAPAFINNTLKSKYPTFASRFTTYPQARANEARVEAEAEKLRGIWRDAKAGNEGWRDALLAFAEAYEGHVGAIRFRLIAQHCATAAKESHR